jgi:hypothetical protein
VVAGGLKCELLESLARRFPAEGIKMPPIQQVISKVN